MSETYDKLNYWYGWNGGECPVHPESCIEGMTVTGTLFGICPARAVTWSHFEDGAVNVIAFRITKLYVEPRKPREFWVNVESDGLIASVHKFRERSIAAIGESVHVREVLPEDEA